MGNTQILCGVTLQIGVPSVPGCGDVSINIMAELQPILMEMLDLTCLSILEGQAWRLQITIQVLQDDGNLWDASLIAAIAALQDTRLPATQRNASSGQMEIVESSNDDDNKQEEKLVFHYLAVPLTVGIYHHDETKTHFCADPTPQEASLLKGQLKMVVNDDNDVVYMQHSSTVGLTRDDLAVAAHMTYGRAKEIRSLLLLE